MKTKFQSFPGIITSFIIGGFFSYAIVYIFFTQTPEGNTFLEILKNIIVWTIGLPFVLSMAIASNGLIKELLCSPYGQSTFGCWGGNSFWISVFVYGMVFALIYYFLIFKKKHKTKNRKFS